jgi:hypothetical protein
MSLPQAHDEQIPDGRIQKTRGAERWVFAVGVLILLGLLGHVLNQQRATTRTSDTHVASAPMPAPAETMPAPAETKPDATQQSPITHKAERPNGSRVTYTVTHKHRLRDCHGTLTFTREGLRFESDEPQDSFAVRLNDVTIEGDGLRIANKTWRFEFDGAVSAERILQDWKTGTLRVSLP